MNKIVARPLNETTASSDAMKIAVYRDASDPKSSGSMVSSPATQNVPITT